MGANPDSSCDTPASDKTADLTIESYSGIYIGNANLERKIDRFIETLGRSHVKSKVNREILLKH